MEPTEVGNLFGFIGLFVAVPIISAVVILADELWVKPMNSVSSPQPLPPPRPAP